MLKYAMDGACSMHWDVRNVVKISGPKKSRDNIITEIEAWTRGNIKTDLVKTL
jgi:hypothetical protein